jgi:hypothetical protein
MDKKLAKLYDKYFKFLSIDFGFKLIEESYHPEHFGNFHLLFNKENRQIKITSDRSQIFIDISFDKREWIDKEKLLQSKGIKMSRYNTINGLWTGYDIENQSKDLKENFNLIFGYD